MKRKNKRKQKSFLSTHPIVLIIAIPMLTFLFMALLVHPNLQPMRDSLLYSIIFKSVISGFVLYFTWFGKKRPIIIEKALLSIVALMPWASLFISSHRLILLIPSVLFVIFILCLLIHFLTDRKYNGITCTVTSLLLLIVIIPVNYYTFLYNSRGIHFWQIGLIMSILITVSFTALLIKGKIKLKDNSTSDKVISSILLFIMSFFCISFMMSNFNYTLDTSKPVEYSTVIISKRVKVKYKKPTRYIIVAKVRNVKKEFYVNQSEYYHKGAGDSFKVLLYSGAFGDEYFICE